MTTLTPRPWMPPVYRAPSAAPERGGRDQARSLRHLIEQQTNLVEGNLSATSTCHSIAVTSGKGGVGKSVLALNLAVSLARRDQRVALIDGSFGLGNLELLCGLNGYWNLSHVVSGARTVQDIVLEGPAGVHLVPGASGLSDFEACPLHVQNSLRQQLQQLEADHDYLIIDTGSGLHPLVRPFAVAANSVFVITTPEPTAIAEAYATIKALHEPQGPELSLVINRCDAERAAKIGERIEQTAESFLHAPLGLAVAIGDDPVVSYSVSQRTPFVTLAPSSLASRGTKAWTEALLARPTVSGEGFFSRLWPRLERRAA